MKNYSNYYYNKGLKTFANSLRKNFTKSEACLWKYALSNKQMKGYTFRRQRPVSNFIVDFCCLQLMLIIELDGLTHHDEKIALKDEKRDKILKESGFTVLRFSDAEVLNKMNDVVNEIEEWIDKVHPRPSATPASGG